MAKAKEQNNVLELVEIFDPDVGKFMAPDGADYQCVYPYYSGAGELVAFRAMFNNRSVYRAYQHHNGRNKKGDIELPYNLPLIIKSAANEEAIHLFQTEGEASRAAELGVPATCLGGGAITNVFKYNHDLNVQNAPWVIWCAPTNKARAQADRDALLMVRNGYRVKVAAFPKGADFIGWNPTTEEISAVLKDVREWKPRAEQIDDARAQGFPNVPYDLNSEAFGAAYYANLYHGEVRYVSEQKTWIRYNGKYWVTDHAGRYAELAKEMAIRLKNDRLRFDEGIGKQLLKLSERIQSQSGKESVLKMARTEPKLQVSVTELDSTDSRDLLTCMDGIINLRTGELESHSPKHLITKSSPFPAVYGQVPVKFMSFLKTTFRDDQVVNWVLKFLAYCLTGQTSWQHFCAWIGKPGTGKSQLQIIMRGLLGPLCGDLDAESLLAKRERSAGVESDLASLAGCRLVLCSELPENARLDERLVKALTGQDVIRVKFMGQDKFDLRTDGKLVFTANTRMGLSPDDAIARRLVELKFEYPPETIVENLGQTILAQEGPQILGMLAEIAPLTYHEGALTLPPKMLEWREDWLQEADTLGEWFASRCEVETYGWESIKSLKTSYETWCENSGIDSYVKAPTFKRFLVSKGLLEHRKQCRGFDGVTVKSDHA